MGDHHIVRPSDGFPVHEDLGDGVNTLENQLKTFPVPEHRSRKCGPILPVDEFVGTEKIGIAPEVGIGNPSRPLKIADHIAGNLRRNRAFGSGCRIPVGKAPGAFQLNF